MKSISEIISLLEAFAQTRNDQGGTRGCVIRTQFISPTLHIDVIDDAFTGLDAEARLDLLQGWIDRLSPDNSGLFADAMARLPVTINPLPQDEADAKKKWMDQSTQVTWVSSFMDNQPLKKVVEHAAESNRFLHFYGYKGGQGRSTVLALLAKALADDGYRVLLLDADVEAPSLDLLFGVSAVSFDQTLMGLCGWSDRFQPIAGAYSGRIGGRIDLVPCRPRTENADLDFALLAAIAPLDARIFENAAQQLQDRLANEYREYDVVMVDHRTGIASSVLPLLNHLPGSAVVFARADMNTVAVPSELRRVVRSIFSATSAIPGVFVSFSLDPNKSSTAEQSPTEARAREILLGELASVIEKTSEQDTEISTAELSLNWIDWYLDRAMLASTLPDVSRLQADNISSLNLLRETLELPIGRRRQPKMGLQLTKDINSHPVSSLSGAKDLGQFIHIPELDKLFILGNTYSYILGRKGTGKTRLLREMAIRSLGIPLLVANDENSTSGLRSQSIEANTWLDKCEYDAPTFWWSMLRMRIQDGAINNMSMESLVRQYLKSGEEPKVLADRLQIKDLILRMPEPNVLLVDGLETLVPAAKIKMFVTSLFDMMGTLQNDPSLASRLIIRSFIREDLASDSVQNVEQQVEGRSLRLKWSAASILNFALSRLPSLTWIGAQFGDVCEEIVTSRSEIERSELTEPQATELMLRIFPSRLRRNNLSTATFLRLYFSDTGGDDTNKGTFYPRLYLSFLQKLDALAAKATNALDSNGRIDSGLLNRAYDDASNEFINETKQELAHLLALDYEGSAVEDDDTAKVSKFIAAFAGLSTPFLHEAIVTELRARTGFTEKSVRESLQRMKAIRMFEDRPGFGGWWRVGQLYKMGLMMKYVRGARD
jgi:Mrp family chromosome partitioning ATPase